MRLKSFPVLTIAITLIAITICAALVSRVSAQAGTRLIAVGGGSGSGVLFLDDAGRIWTLSGGRILTGTVPGAVALWGYQGNGVIYVACANGDVYTGDYGSGWHPTFQLIGNVLSGAPVPTIPQSWNQVKERYR